MNYVTNIARTSLLAALATCTLTSSALAWDPPDGPSVDQATPPATPDTLLRPAHGYITQTGISILYNDGYWFAAQQIRASQQELLNGVRYADVYRGRQEVVLESCEAFGIFCQNVKTLASWPLAADNHYFNPDTGGGLDTGALHVIATWAPLIPPVLLESFTGGLIFLDLQVSPALESSYPSALEMIDMEYANALGAYRGQSVTSIGGRSGTALAMFYLGWSSHLVQDLSVVHHTFDEPRRHHAEYEAAADGFVTTPPRANGTRQGIYENQLPALACTQGARRCFGSYAAYSVHDAGMLDSLDNGNYMAGIQIGVPLAQKLQAGLYAAFLTDIGKRPVHMAAVTSALANYTL